MLQQIAIGGTRLEVSELALGAMLWGTTVSADNARGLYDVYREAGGNVFDTAHIYAAWERDGLGVSERTLGQIVRARNERERVVLMTKGGHPPVSFYAHPERYLSPEVIRGDIRESLERLGFPSVDLFLLHRDDRRVPVGEIIGVLNEEVAAGRIGYFGVSNWRPARVDEANTFARRAGVLGFVVSQPQFSLARPNKPEAPDDLSGRFLTPDDVAWHRRTKFPAFCYSPTAQGYFATDGKAAAKGYENPVSRGRLERAKELAAKHGAGVTTNQVAIAWMRSLDFPAIPLLGTGKAEHLRDAIAGARLELSAQEAEWLAGG